MVKYTRKIRRQFVFYHFVGLAFQGLRVELFAAQIINNFSWTGKDITN